MKVLERLSVLSRRRVLLGVALLLTLPAWWLAAASWANGITGYLGTPGVGVATFAWLALHAVSAAVIIAGVPTAVRGTWERGLLVGPYALLASVIALPNLVVGATDGLRPAGLVVGAVSIVQVAMAIGGLTNSLVSGLRRSESRR
jgi:hypothetical protein